MVVMSAEPESTVFAPNCHRSWYAENTEYFKNTSAAAYQYGAYQYPHHGKWIINC